MVCDTFRFICRDEKRQSNDVLECKYDTEDSIRNKQVLFDMNKLNYLVFHSITEMKNHIAQFGETGQTFHEVIFGFVKQKLKFDIDAEYDDVMKMVIPAEYQEPPAEIVPPVILTEEENQYVMDILNSFGGGGDDLIPEPEKVLDKFDANSEHILHEFIRIIRTAFIIHFQMELPYKNIIICKSVPKPGVEQKKKCSYHIIVDGFYVANNQQAAEFTRRMLEIVPPHLIDFLDKSVNKKIQNFRLTGSRKPNSWRIKTITTDHTFEQTLITNVAGCDQLRSFNIVKPEYTPKSNHLHPDDVRKVLEICEANGIMKDHKFRAQKRDGLFIFNRLRPSYCNFCQKQHEHDGTTKVWTFTINNVTRVYKACWHDKAKQSITIGEFPSSMAPTQTNNKAGGPVEQKNMFWGEGVILRAINAIKTEGALFSQRNLFDDLPADLQHTYDESSLRPFELTNTLCVKAHMKMGKTKALRAYIDNHFSSRIQPATVYILSFRQTFSNSLKENFPEFTLYSDVKGALNQQKLIIQVESLHRLLILENMEAPDLLVLDECESIFEQFDSGLLKNFSGAFAAFQWLLKRTKHVVCMDAYLGNRTFRILQRMRPAFAAPDAGVVYHCNKYQNAKKDEYFLTANKILWLGLVYTALENDERLTIPISSLNEGKAILKILSRKYPNKNMKLYSSETKMSEKKEHFSDVNTHWSQYDVLIYTPTVSAGVSFERIHFSKIFAYFTDQSCPVETCMQMIGRIRNVAMHQFYVCMSATGNNLPTEVDEIIAGLYAKRENLMKTFDDSMLSFEYTETGQIKYHKSDYFYMWAENTRIKNLSRNSFMKRFIHYASLAGAKISHLDETVYKTHTGLQMMVEGELNTELTNIELMHNTAKKEVKEETVAQIAEARDITEEEFESIVDIETAQGDITPEQINSMRKYRLRKHYNHFPDPEGKDPTKGVVNAKFVARYNDPKIRRIYRNLNRIAGTNSVDEALKQIQNEERANYVYTMDMSEAAQAADVNRKYVFDQHRIALGYIKACGWHNITDCNYINVNRLANNLRTAEKDIVANMSMICTEFQLKRPSLQNIIGNRDNDAKYVEVMLGFINKVLGLMYGIRVGTLRGDKSMFLIYTDNLFTTDPNDFKRRPLITPHKKLNGQ